MAVLLPSQNASRRQLALPVLLSLLVCALVGVGVYQSRKIAVLEVRVADVEKRHLEKRSVDDSELDRLVEVHVKRQLTTRGLQPHPLQQFVKELITSETHLLESFCSNSSLLCLPGQKGESGRAGPKGESGLTGGLGPRGPLGPKGDEGDSGSRGPSGPSGPAGVRGLRGPKGDVGSRGKLGLPGTKGDKGERGVPGPSGSSGPPGPKGDSAGGQRTGPVPQDCCLMLSYPKYQGTPSEVVHALVGQEVILPCKGSGYPPPVVKWNMRSMLPAARYTEITDGLNIHGVRTTDSGKVFECIISNIFGTTKKHIRLDVTAPLSASVTPSTSTVEESRALTVVLSCAYKGFPRPTVVWRHLMANGQTADLSAGVDNSASGVSTLTIHNTKWTDAGVYTCRVSNSVESQKSSSTLVVLGRPHFVVPPRNQTVLAGSTFTIKCDVSGVPKPVVAWVFPNGQRQPRFNVKTNSDNSLTVTGATHLNEGAYLCKARNRYGSIQMPAAIQIIHTVTVTLTPNNTSLKHALVSIECRASGDPVPSISWSKVDGTIDRTDGRYIILGGDLVISRITDATRNKDSGIYQCTASNVRNTVTKQAIVYNEIKAVSCNSTFQICSGTPGLACGGTCPPGCASQAGNVFGYKDYTANSPLCRAGIHTGVVGDAGGLVTWVMRDGSFLTFLGETHHGITSFSTGPIHAAASIFMP